MYYVYQSITIIFSCLIVLGIIYSILTIQLKLYIRHLNKPLKQKYKKFMEWSEYEDLKFLLAVGKHKECNYLHFNFNGKQFVCSKCGYATSFSKKCIDKYKTEMKSNKF